MAIPLGPACSLGRGMWVVGCLLGVGRGGGGDALVVEASAGQWLPCCHHHRHRFAHVLYIQITYSMYQLHTPRRPSCKQNYLDAMAYFRTVV